MELYGISYHESRGRISYDLPDRETPIRGRQLGADFEMDHILLVISTHSTLPKIDPPLRLVVDLERSIKTMQNPTYARKVKLTNLQQMAKTVAFLQENGIGSLEELSALQAAAQEDYASVHEALLKTDSRIRKVNILIRNYGQYLSHKQTYRDYLQAKNKQQRGQHDKTAAFFLITLVIHEIPQRSVYVS